MMNYNRDIDHEEQKAELKLQEQREQLGQEELLHYQL
jgi:hypothetical protein